MKKTCIILAVIFICWVSVPGAFGGQYNNNTHQAQEKLNSLGYAPGPADGMMGDKTRTAVKKFQKDRGLKATGGLDNNTLNLLLNKTTGSARQAGKGHTASSQKLLTAQQLLQALGYSPGPADGRMGNKTRAAIKKFQKDQNMSVNGTLNDATLQRMKKASNNKSSDRNKQPKQVSKNKGHKNPSEHRGNKDSGQEKRVPMGKP